MRGKVLTGAIAVAAIALSAPLSAGAHPHFITTPSHQQFLANSAVHPAFTFNADENYWQSCGLSGAAYGMETAHHGPDVGSAGAGDSCYANETLPVPGLDANPVIR